MFSELCYGPSQDNAFFTAGCIVLLAAPVFCFVCFRKKASSLAAE